MTPDEFRSFRDSEHDDAFWRAYAELVEALLRGKEYQMRKSVMIEFHGGPRDGRLLEIKVSSVKDHFVQINGTPNIMKISFPTETTVGHHHVYWSNGPVDFPLMESHIDLYYEGIME